MSIQLIKKTARPFCPVCNQKGKKLYDNLPDRLFATKDTWSMKQCENSICKTCWLDPTPLKEDIYKLYTTYPTHEYVPYTPPKKNNIRNILEKVRLAYMKIDYGYGGDISYKERLLALIAYIHPAWRDTQAANILYLPFKENGVFLDVGCGGGAAIKTMEQWGWKGVGTDFDKKAIENAKRNGIEAYHGELSQLAFPNDTFDAILLSHVIEHVPEPSEILNECKRILKKDGVVIMITPNANSRGHLWYKKNWRGLETPHHLQLFTIESLGNLAKKSNFKHVRAFSSIQGAYYILNSSHNLKHYNQAHIHAKSSLLKKILEQSSWFILGWVHIFFSNTDEVAVVVARK